jgi:uncharacterized protein YrrD
MGDDGNRIGRLVDAAFDQDNLEIDAYLLQSSLFDQLIGRRARIQPALVHSCSRELMIFATGHVKELPAAATTVEQTPPLEMRMPLKTEDRMPEPSFEQVPDGQPVGARPR